MRVNVAELRRRYKYTRCDTDRYGNVRWYTLCGETGRKVRMHEEPGSDAWVEERRRIRNGTTAATNEIPKPGTIARLIYDYTRSPEFSAFAKNTQRAKANALKGISQKVGKFKIDELQPANIRAGRDGMRDKPAAANERIKILSALYNWGIEHGYTNQNPARGVKKLKIHSGGFHTWTPAQCQQFEDAHPIGTMARLAYSLALYTGSRRVDVAGFQHGQIRDGYLHLTQQKTNRRLTLWVTPELQSAIDAVPVKALTLIYNEFEQPFSAEGLGNWFADRCREAVLPDECRMHGLRKAIAARLAEEGYSAKQISAVTGHMSLSEVQRYVADADQARMAEEALRAFSKNRN